MCYDLYRKQDAFVLFAKRDRTAFGGEQGGFAPERFRSDQKEKTSEKGV